MSNEQPEQTQATTELSSSDAVVSEISRSPASSIGQSIKGDHNQAIGEISAGTGIGSVQGSVFNISGSTITHVTGAGDTQYQKAPDQIREILNKEPKVFDKSLSVKTILVLAANPKGTPPLRLREEVRLLQLGLERSGYRDRFAIEERWAVTAIDMRRALLDDCKPQIVHFSGHGTGSENSENELSSTKPEGLIFEDDTGQPKLVSGEALASLFALFSDQVECVVLNACYSAVQAKAIAQHIPYVVGMKQVIGDKAAIEFAIGFYDALLAGRSVEFAHKLGCNAIQMAGIPEHLTPQLFLK